MRDNSSGSACENRTRIVLASASPRRRELLQMLGVRDFAVCPARGEEREYPGLSPRDTVIRLASDKLEQVREKAGKDDIIIAADTIVLHGGQMLGKPKDEREAKTMLTRLSGDRHTVFTGVAVGRGGALLTGAEATEVFFRELSAREIEAYVNSGEPMDKAGAYGAQGLASLFVRRLEGDFFNVMGLPLCLLGKMLSELGFNLL